MATMVKRAVRAPSKEEGGTDRKWAPLSWTANDSERLSAQAFDASAGSMGERALPRKQGGLVKGKARKGTVVLKATCASRSERPWIA